ncbi:related to Pheromone receptor a2 [Moesziomyces antarcticus]|uniref:Related to Pheromone receptor a2 n=1 Tax=Pseudozyma antarctica TaxID=84753 RepID=A0A5C3FNI2_PSEA2|nr:related to Pheromone receptor a2 [Moesziomyces antarcticus]
MFSIAENNTYAAFCLIAACLSTLSVPVHVRAGNTAVLLMIFWCSLGLVNKGVNTLAFNHKLRVTWMFACDISAIIERTWQLGLCCAKQAGRPGRYRVQRTALQLRAGALRILPMEAARQRLVRCVCSSLALSGLRPYPGWKQFHAQFNTINFIPMIRDGSMRGTLVQVNILRWLSLSPGLALFVFFGLTDEAKSIYGFFWSFVKGGRRSAQFKKSSSPLRDHRSLTNGTELDLEDFQRSTDKISVALHKDVLVS